MNTPPKPPSPLTTIDPQAAARSLMNAIARDVACQIEKLETILQRRGMTEEQYAKLLNNPYYKQSLALHEADWKSASNAAKRTQIQAAYLAEDALPYLWKRAIDPTEPFSAANEAVKILLKAGGLGEAPQQQGTGEKFQININIGEGKVIHQEFETKTIEATASEGDPNVKTIELTGRRDATDEGGSG